MKYYITGSTRGLGKYLAGIFSCETFDRPVYDLTVDFDLVCNNIQDNSVVILNAHANQIEYVKRLHNRCKLTGRPKGYMRKFGINRVTFRKMALEGKIPGLTKSSW